MTNTSYQNDTERASKALFSLDPGAPRETWVRIGMAAKEAGLSEDDFISWSAKARNYKSESDCRSTWRSFSAQGGIGAGTLFMLANEAAGRGHPKHTRLIEKPVHKPQTDVFALWDKLVPASDNHPYIVKKQGLADGLRIRSDGWLAVPAWKDGQLQTIQFISPTGEKKNQAGASFNSGYYVCGTITDSVYIVEGIGHAWAAHKATGQGAICSFGFGNVAKVAQVIMKLYPDVQIVVVADIGKETETEKMGFPWVAIPHEGLDAGADINDYTIKFGCDAAKVLLSAPQRPSSTGIVEKLDSNLPPEPLPELPPVEPFDYAFLPPILHDYVLDLAWRMQSPADFAAATCIVMLSSIIGRKVSIRPKRYDTWTIIPNLWGAIIGLSGSMKSPCMSAALAPMIKLQNKAFALNKKTKTETFQHEELEKLKKSLNKANAKKRLAKDFSADVSDLMQADERKEASVKRYSTNDSSYEKLGELMEQNPNGLLAISDEIIGLLKRLDAQGQEAARAFYLTGADGDKPYTFDRIIRGTVHLNAVCLSIIGAIQPGIIGEYVRQAVSGGAGADGLLQRFGILVYPNLEPNFCYVDIKPNLEAREKMDELVEYFDEQLEVMVHGEVAEDGDAIQFLRFDDDAQELFIIWYTELQTRLRSGEDHEAIASHLSKYASLIPSLALIFHLCENRRGAVGKESLLRAIEYGRYLETHANRVYSFGTRPDIAAAKSLEAKIKNGKIEDPFTARDVYLKGWTGLETAEKALDAINLLCEYRHLIPRQLETGGRPTTVYTRNISEA